MSSSKIKGDKNNLEEEDDDSIRAKIDPDFARVMYKCYKEQEVKIRPELNEKLMEIPRAHKRKLETEDKADRWDRILIRKVKRFLGLDK